MGKSTSPALDVLSRMVRSMCTMCTLIVLGRAILERPRKNLTDLKAIVLLAVLTLIQQLQNESVLRFKKTAKESSAKKRACTLLELGFLVAMLDKRVWKQ